MKKQVSFKNENNFLYIIPTPIGNLNDISTRVIDILTNQIDILLCEDTRHTQKLLNHLNIKIKTISYHEYSDENSIKKIMNKLEEGTNIGLVSDAGMPLISDPGYKLVNEIQKLDINIVVVPGPTAFLLPLVWSGFSTEEFSYLGFMKKRNEETYKKILDNETTAILYESPHKLLSTLNALQDIDQDRQIVVAKELTKINETFIKGTTKEIYEELKSENVKGEFVIVIDKKNKDVELQISIYDQYKGLLDLEYSKKEAMKEVAKIRKMKKSEIYQIVLEEENE